MPSSRDQPAVVNIDGLSLNIGSLLHSNLHSGNGLATNSLPTRQARLIDRHSLVRFDHSDSDGYDTAAETKDGADGVKPDKEKKKKRRRHKPSLARAAEASRRQVMDSDLSNAFKGLQLDEAAGAKKQPATAPSPDTQSRSQQDQQQQQQQQPPPPRGPPRTYPREVLDAAQREMLPHMGGHNTQHGGLEGLLEAYAAMWRGVESGAFGGPHVEVWNALVQGVDVGGPPHARGEREWIKGVLYL